MASDTITLANLPEKLPQWHPDDKNHLYAVVDMGSNGIRFSIISLEPPRTRLLTPVYSTRVDVSLFDALQPSPVGLAFHPTIVTTVSSAVSQLHHSAVAHGVPPEHVMILATEAMRRAVNAPEMLQAIWKATGGVGVHILDPPVETLLGAVMGSRSVLGGVPGGALFLDLGGGSVQMTWVDTSNERYEIDAATAGQSMPFGAAKLIRVLEEHPEEARIMETANLKDGIKKAYADLCARFPVLQAIRAAHERGEDSLVDVYMCGGGFRGYGSMLMHDDPISPYPIPSLSTYSAPGSRFKQTAKMLQINQEYPGKIFGLSKRRRWQFPAIVTVVEAFIEAVPNIGWVTFCGGSNRQGALMMKLPREVRESNPLNVLADVKDHERPVFDAILQKLSTALPSGVDLSRVPNIFTTGLGFLFIREVWNRCGYDASSNSSFVLNNSIVRDTDCPGLTHLARAVLGLGISARWGGSLGPVDVQLHRRLRALLENRGANASFWVQYLGGIAGVLATIFPVLPNQADQVSRAVSFESRIEKRQGKKDKIILMIGVAAEDAKGIDQEDLVDKVNAAAANKDGGKPPMKISANFFIQS